MRSSRDLGGLPRDALPTVPEKTVMELPRTSSVNDDTSSRRGRPRLTWAVDLGEEVRAMSTVDLWYSLNVGDISPDVLVWRLGLEGWAPAREVPEVACSIREMPVELPIDEELRRAEEERETLGFSFEIPSRSVEPIVDAMTADGTHAAPLVTVDGPYVDAGSPMPAHVRELRPPVTKLARLPNPRLARRYAGIAAGLGAVLAIATAVASGGARSTSGGESMAGLVAVQETAAFEAPASPQAPALVRSAEVSTRDATSPGRAPMAKCPVAIAPPETPAAPRAKAKPWRARPAAAPPSAGARGQVRARRSSK